MSARESASRRRMTSSLSAARARRRRSSSARDGGRMKMLTVSGICARTWRAPCQSISSSTSLPCASVRSTAVRAVPFRSPCTTACSKNSPRRDHRLEHGARDEVVVHAVDLVRPRRARGVRHRQRDARFAARAARGSGWSCRRQRARRRCRAFRAFVYYSMFCTCSRICSISTLSSTAACVVR